MSKLKWSVKRNANFNPWRKGPIDNKKQPTNELMKDKEC